MLLFDHYFGLSGLIFGLFACRGRSRRLYGKYSRRAAKMQALYQKSAPQGGAGFTGGRG